MADDLQKAVEDLSRRAQKQAADEIIDAQIRVMAGTFDKATAYANLLVLAGYASFFGLWQVTKGQVDTKLSTLAALLMAVSATVFVFFEVAKSLYHSISLNRLNKVMTGPAAANPHLLLQAIAEHNKTQDKATTRLFRWWLVAFIITVVAGLGAVGILMSAFVGALLS